MRLRISRKIFILFILLFFISLLALGGYIYFENTGRTKSAYLEELESYCETTGSMLEKKMLCVGVLNGYWFNSEGEECFNVSILSEDYEFIAEESICREKGFIQLERELINKERGIPDEKGIPVDIELVYSRKFIGEMYLQRVVFSPFTDEEILSLVDEMSERGLSVPPFRTDSEEALFDNGYFVEKYCIDVEEENCLGMLFLYFSEVKEVVVVDGALQWDVNTVIKGDSYNMVVSSTNFYLEPSYYDVANYEEADISGEYMLAFLYFKEEDIDIVKLREHCSSSDGLKILNPVCELVKSDFALEDYKIEDIDDYIDERISNYDGENIFLEKLIFATFFER
jgi:hypothetical protein